jgi:hypothetical protein
MPRESQADTRWVGGWVGGWVVGGCGIDVEVTFGKFGQALILYLNREIMIDCCVDNDAKHFLINHMHHRFSLQSRLGRSWR